MSLVKTIEVSESCNPTDRNFINLHVIASAASFTMLMAVAAFTLS